MYTFDTETASFFYKGDLSGEVVITVVATQVEDGLGNKKLVTIPFSELKNFILEQLRRKSIRNIEEMSVEEFEAWLTVGTC